MILRTVEASKVAVVALIAGLIVIPVPTAQAELVAKVDLSSQRMQVFVNGKKKYTWRVSTGKRGYTTPKGSFTPSLHFMKLE